MKSASCPTWWMRSSSKAMAVSTEVMPGVAIVANNTWTALSAKKKLKVVWDETNASKDSWTALTAQAKEAGQGRRSAGTEEGRRCRCRPSTGKKSIEGFYTYGFVSHAPLEPMNTTAWYKKDPAGDKLEIWGSVQMSDGARTAGCQAWWVLPQPTLDAAPDAHRRWFRSSHQSRVRLRSCADLQAGRWHSGEAHVHARRRHDARLLSCRRLPSVEGCGGRPGQARGLGWTLHHVQRRMGRATAPVAAAGRRAGWHLSQRVPGGIHAELPHDAVDARRSRLLAALARTWLQHGGVGGAVVHA